MGKDDKVVYGVHFTSLMLGPRCCHFLSFVGDHQPLQFEFLKSGALGTHCGSATFFGGGWVEKTGIRASNSPPSYISHAGQ